MFSYDGAKRPTVEQLKDHPWMKKDYDIKGIRSDLVERLSASRSEKTADSSNAAGTSRAGDGADQMLELVRQDYSMSALTGYQFNDMTDYDTTADPGHIVELLNEFNIDCYES